MRFLADLALFVEVANTGNFRRAAAALGMPASTLSRRISALEQELGFQLIHRSSRTFALTDAGKTCYEQSKTLVTEAKRIQENVAGLAHQASGHIRLGVPFDLAQTIFLPLFARYMDENPGTSIEILSISGHPNLLTESLDMAIWVGHSTSPAGFLVLVAPDRAGAYAEFVLVNAASLAYRPASISAEVGAAIALVGQTATQMLSLSKVKAGQTLLILGASGGVGTLAIQLAKNSGVKVIATARGNKIFALHDLGAERVIDTSKQRLEDAPKVDTVLNLVGGDTVVPSYALVKKGGVAVTANRPPIAEEAERLGIEAKFVETNVTTEGLDAFAALVAKGKVKPQIAAVKTLWSPETLWNEHETEEIGKIVFSIRS